MLSLDDIDESLKQQQKEQRLGNLKAQWFEYYMNKIQFEANGMSANAQAAQKKMDELQISYDAVLNIEV